MAEEVIVIKGEVVHYHKQPGMGFYRIEVEDLNHSGKFQASGVSPATFCLGTDDARKMPGESYVEVTIRVLRKGPEE
jgi:hypothetical protein